MSRGTRVARGAVVGAVAGLIVLLTTLPSPSDAAMVIGVDLGAWPYSGRALGATIEIARANWKTIYKDIPYRTWECKGTGWYAYVIDDSNNRPVAGTSCGASSRAAALRSATNYCRQDNSGVCNPTSCTSGYDDGTWSYVEANTQYMGGRQISESCSPTDVHEDAPSDSPQQPDPSGNQEACNACRADTARSPCHGPSYDALLVCHPETSMPSEYKACLEPLRQRRAQCNRDWDERSAQCDAICSRR